MNQIEDIFGTVKRCMLYKAKDEGL